MTPPRAPKTLMLTERERDCMRLVAMGKPDTEIAHRLGIANSTVKYYIDSARHKLTARNRAHAVAMLLSRGPI